MKTALVTGITGQDGSYLAEFLLEKGYTVYGMVRRASRENFERIEHIRHRVDLRQADLLDQLSLIRLVEETRPREIYNLAAQSFVPTSWTQPVLTGEFTVLGVTRLLDAIRLVDPTIRFYQASSSEIFGEPLERPQTEATPLAPLTPYGVAKAYGHFITRSYRTRYGLHASSGILYNHESPRRPADFLPSKVARGAALYHNGDRFESLYAVRSGSFKTMGVSRHGDEKVTAFHLPGELLGLDAISNGRHGYSAVALEDSEVCILPFATLEKLAMSVPALQHQLLRIVSSDISRDHGLMLLLGSMTAEQRLAAFLLSLSRRHERLGFSANRFVLRMTREETGNYLGLTLETVSRLFSRFQREGLVRVQQRDVEILDKARLMELVGHW